jgi:hypothetical protein
MRKRCRQQAGGDRWAVDGRKHGHPCALSVWGSPPSPSFIYLLILLVIFQSRVKSCRCLIEYSCCQRTKSDAEMALLQNDHNLCPIRKATLQPASTDSIGSNANRRQLLSVHRAPSYIFYNTLSASEIIPATPHRANIYKGLTLCQAFLPTSLGVWLSTTSETSVIRCCIASLGIRGSARSRSHQLFATMLKCENDGYARG